MGGPDSGEIRIVLDASAPTSNRLSLNDALATCPNLVPDLMQMSLRFRKTLFLLSADCSKMYLRIRVAEADQDFLRFLWFDAEMNEVLFFKFLVLIWGLGPASFLAIACLRWLALWAQKRYPLAARAILDDTFVDDLFMMKNREDKLFELAQQMDAMLAEGDFTLAKFCSNSSILETIPSHLHKPKALEALKLGRECIKLLGISWQPKLDVLTFRVPDYAPPPAITRRHVLSEIVSVFDPQGLAAPTMLMAKDYFQELWVPGMKWDENLSVASPQFLRFWTAWRSDLVKLNQIAVPRCFMPYTHFDEMDLFVMVDASKKGSASVAYLRTRVGDKVYVTFVSAKTKIASRKANLSTARLELEAMKLGARHVKGIQESGVLPPNANFCFWSDSLIALYWLWGDPLRWGTFVRNRVTFIHEVTGDRGAAWFFVPGELNCGADLASRGCSASDLLLRHPEFHAGPDWLALPKHLHPTQPEKAGLPDLVAADPVSVHFVELEAAPPPPPLELPKEFKLDPSKFNDAKKLHRATAILIKFIDKYLRKKPISNYITLWDLDRAEKMHLRAHQKAAYPREIAALTKRLPLPQTHLLHQSPVLDHTGLMRVGGRLQYAEVPSPFGDQFRHPIIVPKSPLTRLIILAAHEHMKHDGANTTFNALRQKYLIAGGGDYVRKIVFQCLRCKPYTAHLERPPMAPLPSRRTLARVAPFTHMGIDLAEKFTIKIGKGRRGHTQEVNVLVSVCMSTRAVDFQICDELNIAAFMNSLRNVISARGVPETMTSDNGGNFTGSRSLLGRLLTAANVERLHRFARDEGFVWNLQTSEASAMSGVWERIIQMMRKILRRCIGGQLLTWSEFHTTLKETEAVLNSRPLAPSQDADLSALTPGHFLIGRPLRALPEPLGDEGVQGAALPLRDTRHRYLLLHQIRMAIWRRFLPEYVSTLNRLQYVGRLKRNLRVGDIVLIYKRYTPRMMWLRGRVIKVFPGADGVVRQVQLITPSRSIIDRPTYKLALMEFDPEAPWNL